MLPIGTRVRVKTGHTGNKCLTADKSEQTITAINIDVLYPYTLSRSTQYWQEGALEVIKLRPTSKPVEELKNFESTILLDSNVTIIKTPSGLVMKSGDTLLLLPQEKHNDL